MLVLAPSVGETVVVCDNITSNPLAAESNRVRIGRNALGDLPVHREEVAQRTA